MFMCSSVFADSKIFFKMIESGSEVTTLQHAVEFDTTGLTLLADYVIGKITVDDGSTVLFACHLESTVTHYLGVRDNANFALEGIFLQSGATFGVLARDTSGETEDAYRLFSWNVKSGDIVLYHEAPGRIDYVGRCINWSSQRAQWEPKGDRGLLSIRNLRGNCVEVSTGTICGTDVLRPKSEQYCVAGFQEKSVVLIRKMSKRHLSPIAISCVNPTLAVSWKITFNEIENHAGFRITSLVPVVQPQGTRTFSLVLTAVDTSKHLAEIDLRSGDVIGVHQLKDVSYSMGEAYGVPAADILCFTTYPMNTYTFSWKSGLRTPDRRIAGLVRSVRAKKILTTTGSEVILVNSNNMNHRVVMQINGKSK